jgi:hypothetical protein
MAGEITRSGLSNGSSVCSAETEGKNQAGDGGRTSRRGNQMRGLDFREGALMRQEKTDLDDIDSWATSKTDRRQQTRTRGARSLKKKRMNGVLK